MKIALFALNGSFSHAALGVRCLGQALEQAGFAAEVIEGNLRERTGELLGRLYAADAALYGFSCYIWNVEQMLALAADLHALRPHAKILFGGPECSFDTDRFTALPFIDTVITGEGEEAICHLATLFQNGEALPRLLHGGKDARFLERGLPYRNGEALPALVYYESSRGCPFSCSFCLSSATDGVRAKSAEQTLTELLLLEAYPGDFTVKLVDRTFNFDRARAVAIWRGLLSARYTKRYHFEIAANLLDEECFAVLAQFPAGKVRLEIGLQSTNTQTLSAIARHADPQAVLTACRRLMQAGNCHVHLDLIAGLPHEDMQSFAAAFDAAYPVCHVLQLGQLKFLHGTAIRRDADRFGAVFSQKPPYTVLKTSTLSYEELRELHEISDLMERLRDSGKFPHTLHFLHTHFPSPFALYRALNTHLRQSTGCEIQKISQRDLFWQISRFARERLPEALWESLSAHLRADFSAAEVRRPPKGL
jgi:hypothetical protein